MQAHCISSARPITGLICNSLSNTMRAVLIKECIEWTVHSVHGTHANAESGFGRLLANAKQGLPGFTTIGAIALVEMHTTRHVGNIVPVNEFTAIRSLPI